MHKKFHIQTTYIASHICMYIYSICVTNNTYTHPFSVFDILREYMHAVRMYIRVYVSRMLPAQVSYEYY